MVFASLDVEAVLCPKRGVDGTHELVNGETGRTRCKHCNASWATLDMRLRQSGKKAEPAFSPGPPASVPATKVAVVELP